MLKSKNSNWQIQAWELYPKLGISAGGHLPDKGFPPRVVEGTTFMCEPSRNIWPALRRGRSRRQVIHRIKYQCPVCSKWIPFGRATQHESRKDHQ